MIRLFDLPWRNWSLLLILAGLLVPLERAGAESGDVYSRLLRESGLEPTADSIRIHLQRLALYAESPDRIDQLIQELGDKDYFRREAATQNLLRLPVLPRERLQMAVAGDDPEIRWRAEQVLKLGQNSADHLLYAVFTIIHTRKLPALTEPVFEVLPHLRGKYLREQAVGALTATARKSDVAWLRKQLAREQSDQHAAVAIVLERLLGSNADPDLRPLLAHKDEYVRLAAARAILNHGNREGLKPLAALLNAHDVAVRRQSVQALQRATGQKFGFVAYEDLSARAPAAEQWQSWVQKHGGTAPLTSPLANEEDRLGRILVCRFHSNQVVEYDRNGKPIWTKDINGPADCDGTSAGHRIVCSSVQKAVYEFDNAGNEIWRIEETPGEPYSVQRLDNGNTLICCADTGHLVEYQQDKSIAWQLKLEGEPLEAQRLANGNTLVTLQKAMKVVEVRRDGTQVWELPNLQRPRSAERLPEGETLVTEMAGRRFAEFDLQRKIVWTHADAGLIHPLHAQRLPGGHTLLSAYNGVRKIDPYGLVLWRSEHKGISRVCSY